MARTIFNTTEKSNFILNMTEEQYAKLASYGIIGACFLVPLFTVIPESMITSTYTLSAGGLAVTGVYCMIMALIALIKKYVKGSVVLPVCGFGAILLWSVISLINSYDPMVSLYGYPQRGEGVLAILFYCSIFITTAAVKRETVVSALVKGLIGTGILNSAWALIQIFAGKLTHYRKISLDITVNAASGLAHSPIFLAMLLTLALTAALITAAVTENKKYRIICTASALLFGFVMIFTYSFAGVAGIVFSVIAAVITSIAVKSPKKNLLSVLAAAVGAALAIVVISAGVLSEVPTSYKLHDGRIAWWADSYMRIGSTGEFNKDVVNIDDNMSVYLYLNDKTRNIISGSPLTGTGPDQLAYPQIYTYGGLEADADLQDIIVQNSGIFDRCYNEYLYTAATRGIPSLIALAVVVLSAVVLAFKKLKKNKDYSNSVVFFLTIGGALLFFIGCTNLPFSPVYWSVAGLGCAAFSSAEKSEPAKAEKKKKK